MSAVRLLVQVIQDGWEGDDPDKAGWLIVKSWTTSVIAAYRCMDERFPALVQSMITSEMTPGEPAGVLLLVDVGHFARQAYAPLDALRHKPRT
jgi:hypothetical protein